MEKMTFLKALTVLGTAYNQEFTNERAIIWYGFFKDEDLTFFQQAIKNLICKSKFMPAISDVKREIAEIKHPSLKLDANEEWNSVLTAIRKYGSYGQIKAMESLNNTTADIVRRIGWDRLCRSERIDFEKRLFISDFESIQNSHREIAQLSNIKRNELTGEL